MYLHFCDRSVLKHVHEKESYYVLDDRLWLSTYMKE